MPKQTTPTVTTELVTYGQPSNTLIAELKRLGQALTAPQIAQAVSQLEATRAKFAVEMVLTGILLLAKKETLPHGKWEPFLAEVWREIRHKGSAASPFAEVEIRNFTRSLRTYCFCGRHFVADFEQNRFAPEGRDLPVTLPAVEPRELLALAELPEEKRAAVTAEVERWLAGRSLRRLLADLRRAESAAEQEESAEEAAAARRRAKGKGAEATGQMDFWDELNRPLTELATLMNSADFRERTTKQGWLQVADTLLAKSREARAIAATIR